MNVTKKQQETALREVAKWLGPRMGYGKDPAPTGRDAADRALGPHLNPAWDWPQSGPTPTILLEGGPFDWAVEVSFDDDFTEKMRSIGVHAEPYAGYALCLYREW